MMCIVSDTYRRLLRVAVLIGTLAAVVGTVPAARGQASFTGIGFVAAGDESVASDVSDDGTVVTGRSNTAPAGATNEAFHYAVAAGTLTGIGLPANWTQTAGNGIDVDVNGEIHIAGTGTNPSGNDQAFYWTSEDPGNPGNAAFVNLVFLGSGDTSHAHDLRMTNDGATVYIVGDSNTTPGGGSSDVHAYRWKRAVSSTQPPDDANLGQMWSGDRCEVLGVGFRTNGQTRIAGWGNGDYSDYGGHAHGNVQAAFWTSVGGQPTGKGGLDWMCGRFGAVKSTSDNTSQAKFNALSSDGEFAAGRATYPPIPADGGPNGPDGRPWQAMIFNNDFSNNVHCGPIHYPLGFLDADYTASGGDDHMGDNYSEALDISRGGEIVVGWSRKLDNVNGGWLNESRAFIWINSLSNADDAETKMQDLQTYLEGLGLDLNGWELREATGVSDAFDIVYGAGFNYDPGLVADVTLCGWGIHNGKTEGWVATIPNPVKRGSCCRNDQGTFCDIKLCSLCFRHGPTFRRWGGPESTCGDCLGACCSADGDSCSLATPDQCTDAESRLLKYHGVGSECGGTSPQCKSSCCLDDACLQQSWYDCDDLDGDWQGFYKLCTDSDVACSIPGGACCSDAQCYDGLTPDQCAALPDGEFQGFDSTCAETVCVLPCNVPFADEDGDEDVDQRDFAMFQRCLTVTGAPILPGCICFDRDNAQSGGHPDGSVTGHDFPEFLNCATGPDVAYDPQNPPPQCNPGDGMLPQ